MSTGLAYYTFVVFVLAISTSKADDGASCQNLCCPGKNSSCFVVNDLSSRRCFCDSHCSRTKDCCSDYFSLCQLEPPINCVLSNWQRWSYCSNKCGSGFQKRNRKILISPRGTGLRCGHLSESRSCQGVLCPAQSQTYRHRKTSFHHKASSPAIQILPDLRSFNSIYKQYSYKHGIRRHIYLRNLWLNNQTESEDIKSPYCSIYQITMVIGNCDRLHKLTTKERANWIEHAMYLSRSNKICVTCYPQNQHNHLQNHCKGSESHSKDSRWRAVMSDDCHGFFRLVNSKKNCKCNQPSFLMI